MKRIKGETLVWVLVVLIMVGGTAVIANDSIHAITQKRVDLPWRFRFVFKDPDLRTIDAEINYDFLEDRINSGTFTIMNFGHSTKSGVVYFAFFDAHGEVIAGGSKDIVNLGAGHSGEYVVQLTWVVGKTMLDVISNGVWIE